MRFEGLQQCPSPVNQLHSISFVTIETFDQSDEETLTHRIRQGMFQNKSPLGMSATHRKLEVASLFCSFRKFFRFSANKA